MFEHFTMWNWLIVAYLGVALGTFVPALLALIFKAKLKDGGTSFDKSPHFKPEERERLKQHYTRIHGTLIFWKSTARKNGRFHYYSTSWTIFSSAIMPFLTQAIDPADAASKWLITTISAHIALCVGFHRGFKVSERFQAFRHGESEFYDLYRRLLDQPEMFGATPEEQIKKYFEEVAIVRRFVRKAETDSVPSLEDIREKPATPSDPTHG